MPAKKKVGNKTKRKKGTKSRNTRSMKKKEENMERSDDLKDDYLCNICQIWGDIPKNINNKREWNDMFIWCDKCNHGYHKECLDGFNIDYNDKNIVCKDVNRKCKKPNTHFVFYYGTKKGDIKRQEIKMNNSDINGKRNKRMKSSRGNRKKKI